MKHIRIDTEQVRESAWRFDYASTQLAETVAALRRAIHSLDTAAWDGRSRWRIEPELGRVTPQCQELSEELHRLGRLLDRVSDYVRTTRCSGIHCGFQPALGY